MTLRAACLAPLLLWLVACRTPPAKPLEGPTSWFRGTAELPREETPPGLLLAFLGDQGLGEDSRAVLELVKAEGAAAVVHLGDFDYKDDPEAWEAQLDAALGPQFPYFAVAGNHDERKFLGKGGYQERIARRLERLGVPWRGEPGLNFAIRWRGVLLVCAAPDVLQLDPEEAGAFLTQELAHDDSPWRFCAWHKNQSSMQTGNKGNEAGWWVYEAARRGGAVVATGHEHAYSRTHLLQSCERQEIAATGSPLLLAKDDPATPADEGRTFVVVSGLGGHSVREQKRGGPWWASVWTKDKGGKPGALFAQLGHQGDPKLARFYFKDVSGKLVDEFLVRAP